jgi:hypothetical protein
METFYTRIKRHMDDAIRQSGRPHGEVLVKREDLRELLHHFERLDSDARNLYARKNISKTVSDLIEAADTLDALVKGQKFLHQFHYFGDQNIRRCNACLAQESDAPEHCDRHASTFRAAAELQEKENFRISQQYNIKAETTGNNRTALMRRELTKDEALTLCALGKFNVFALIACHHCENEGVLSDGQECADCSGTGMLIEHHLIDWNIVQNIYKKAIELFEVKP